MEKRKIYDRDFKVNAVKLALKTNGNKVAKKLGIATTNIYRWQNELQKYGTDSFCGGGHFRTSEQKKFCEMKRTLNKDLKYTELQIEIFRSASKYIIEGKPMIFHFIEKNLDKYPLWQMCKVLGTKEISYYKWRDKFFSPTQLQKTLIKEEITSIFYEYKGRYGNGKIYAELESRGFKLNKSSVSKYMKKMGLVSKLSCKHKISSSSFIPHNPYIFPNVLNRQFNTAEPSQVWVSGITRLQTLKGLLFLTIIIDLFDRKIIGWNLSEALTIKETSIPAWEMAVHNRKTKKGLIFHSDRGIQYANKMFTRKLNSYKNIIRSMSRKGNHLDNEILKSFFISLKTELVDLNMLLTREQMQKKIREYIENLDEKYFLM